MDRRWSHYLAGSYDRAYSVIGAGSVVTRSIPADCVAVGNPCRVIKHMNNEPD